MYKLKFVKRSRHEQEASEKHITITYTVSEIFLGALLIISNIAVIMLIYNYILKPQNKPYSYTKNPAYPAASPQQQPNNR